MRMTRQKSWILTGVDSDAGLSQMQDAQKRRHEAQKDVHAQQSQLLQNSIEQQVPKSQGPLRLGQLQCVICLDSMTDVTALHCGMVPFALELKPTLTSQVICSVTPASWRL